MLLQRAFVYGFDLIGAGMDPSIIWMLRRLHFPAARLWAAANSSDGDLEALKPGLSERALKRIDGPIARRAYAAVLSGKAEAEDATAAWREAALAGAGADPAIAERTRRRAASRHLAAQAPLAAAVGRKGLPLVRWDMRTPVESPAPPAASAFDAPADLLALEPGPIYREGDVMRQWVTAPAETGVPGDRSLARASWPADGEVRAVVVVGSGVGVEWDLYVRMRADFDFPTTFARRGLAVIEIVSPGHGMRVAPDRYGGEAFFASAPVTSAAMLAAQCREAARYLAWARTTWERPVGIFGVSMSSFAAQLILSHAGRWPEAARPDGGFLLAHAGDLMGVVRGRLASALGIAAALESAGWTDADLARWRDALRPADTPAASPERIVSAIGYLDRVTPFRDGAALTKAWGLPKENRFRLPHGHMCLPTRIRLDDGPVARFAEVLAAV